MNFQKVDSSKSYDYTHEVIRDTYNVLRNFGCYDISINTTTPLEDFSMLEGKAANMRPYAAFKISFNVNVSVCLE
jgi:hypothetical protein